QTATFGHHRMIKRDIQLLRDPRLRPGEQGTGHRPRGGDPVGRTVLIRHSCTPYPRPRRGRLRASRSHPTCPAHRGPDTADAGSVTRPGPAQSILKITMRWTTKLITVAVPWATTKAANTHWSPFGNT